MREAFALFAFLIKCDSSTLAISWPIQSVYSIDLFSSVLENGLELSYFAIYIFKELLNHHIDHYHKVK